MLRSRFSPLNKRFGLTKPSARQRVDQRLDLLLPPLGQQGDKLLNRRGRQPRRRNPTLQVPLANNPCRAGDQSDGYGTTQAIQINSYNITVAQVTGINPTPRFCERCAEGRACFIGGNAIKYGLSIYGANG